MAEYTLAMFFAFEESTLVVNAIAQNQEAFSVILPIRHLSCVLYFNFALLIVDDNFSLTVQLVSFPEALLVMLRITSLLFKAKAFSLIVSVVPIIDDAYLCLVDSLAVSTSLQPTAYVSGAVSIHAMSIAMLERPTEVTFVASMVGNFVRPMAFQGIILPSAFVEVTV